PTHKAFLCTNHRPLITGTDHGIWRRLRLLPFEVTFWDPADPANHGKGFDPAKRQDKQLPAMLKHERPGILAWGVQGCLDWQRDGLVIPAKVRVATNEYRSSEDAVGQFLEECALIGPEYREKAGTLYARYR